MDRSCDVESRTGGTVEELGLEVGWRRQEESWDRESKELYMGCLGRGMFVSLRLGDCIRKCS